MARATRLSYNKKLMSEDLKDVRKARQKLYTEGAVITAGVSAAMPAPVVESATISPPSKRPRKGSSSSGGSVSLSASVVQGPVVGPPFETGSIYPTWFYRSGGAAFEVYYPTTAATVIWVTGRVCLVVVKAIKY